MTAWDGVVLGVLGVAAAYGFSRGFISQIFFFVAVFFGLWLALRLTPATMSLVDRALSPNPQLLLYLSLGINFVVLLVLILLVGRMLRHVTYALQLRWLDALLGALFSFVSWGLLLSVLLMLIFRPGLPVGSSADDDWEAGPVVRCVMVTASHVYPYVTDLYHEAYGRIYEEVQGLGEED